MTLSHTINGAHQLVRCHGCMLRSGIALQCDNLAPESFRFAQWGTNPCSAAAVCCDMAFTRIRIPVQQRRIWHLSAMGGWVGGWGRAAINLSDAFITRHQLVQLAAPSPMPMNNINQNRLDELDVERDLQLDQFDEKDVDDNFIDDEVYDSQISVSKKNSSSNVPQHKASA